jgi:GTPase SAR1 family protein
VDYHQVMAQHKLGPNGAILTCLNLFATKFDQVMSILERRSFGDAPAVDGSDNDGGGENVDEKSGDDGEEETKPAAAEAASSSPSAPDDDSSDKKAKAAKMKKLLDYILVDTPGQIESFSWSASGQIFSESLASAFPTVLAYVVDTPRCASSPNTFMSNMLYACSMMYRTRLPLVVVFNKTDVVGSEFAEEWMTDYEAFQTALDDFTTENSGDAATGGYYASLTRSLSLVLDEFYSVLHHCGVSAATGDGVSGFWDAVDRAAQDFEADYVADLRDRVEERKARRRAKARHDMKRLERDMKAASLE